MQFNHDVGDSPVTRGLVQSNLRNYQSRPTSNGLDDFITRRRGLVSELKIDADLVDFLKHNKMAFRGFMSLSDNDWRLQNFAVDNCDWELMTQLGNSYPTLGIESFVRTFGDNSLSTLQKDERAGYFSILLGMLRPQLLSHIFLGQSTEVTKIMEGYILALETAAKYGNQDIVELLMKEDWFDLSGVFSQFRQSNKYGQQGNFGRAQSIIMESIYKHKSRAKSQRFFWIFLAATKAMKYDQQLTANYLLSFIREQMGQEADFIRLLASDLVQQKEWDILNNLSSYINLWIPTGLPSRQESYRAHEHAERPFPQGRHSDSEQRESLTPAVGHSDLLTRRQVNMRTSLQELESDSMLPYLRRDSDTEFAYDWDSYWDSLRAREPLQPVVTSLDHETNLQSSSETVNPGNHVMEENIQPDDSNCQICLENEIKCYFTCKDANRYNHGACKEVAMAAPQHVDQIRGIMAPQNNDQRQFSLSLPHGAQDGFARVALLLQPKYFSYITKFMSHDGIVHDLAGISPRKWNEFFHDAIAYRNWNLVKLMIEREMYDNQDDIALAFESVSDWDVFLYLGSKFPNMALKYIYKFTDKGKSEKIWEIFNSLSTEKRYDFASDPQVLDSLRTWATVTCNWALVAEIGVVKPSLGLDLFTESLDFTYLEPQQLISRSRYQDQFLADLWEKQKVQKMKGISESIVRGMLKASEVGNLEFLEAVTKHDWFSLAKVDLYLIPELDYEAITHLQYFLSSAKKERVFWILKSINAAEKSNQKNSENYLVNMLLKEDLAQEKPLLDKLAEFIAQSRNWDDLLKMAPYARLSMIQAYLKHCITAQDDAYINKFMNSSNVKLSPQDEKELYETLLSSDKLSLINLSLLEADFSNDHFKKLLAKQETALSNQCQICMDRSIECYYNCRLAKKYKHGACKACHSMIQDFCPFCRAPQKKRFSFLKIF